MAKIIVDFTQMPIPPELGVDFEEDWDTKANLVLNWQRINMYQELSDFKVQVNSLRDEVNQSRSISVSASNVASSAVQQSQQNATTALNAKNDTEVIKQEVQNIADNLVIPVEATYNQSTLDTKFDDMELENFLDFKI